MFWKDSILDKNFWLAQASAGAAYFSNLSFEGTTKVLGITISLVTAVFFAIKVYYDMRRSRELYKKEK